MAAEADKLILHAHLENSESYLLEVSKVPSVSGHSLHKGTAREVFIREFLGEHLPADFAIGTGELIDHKTVAGGKRNQHDTVIYERSFPRIHLGGNVHAFLFESVVATIEIKSTLDAEGILNAVDAARNAKALESSGSFGWRRPIANYVLSYSGPTKMETAFNWIVGAYEKLGLVDPDVPDPMNRASIVSPALDGVYVLGVGACIFENNVGYLHHPERQKLHPRATWTVLDSPRGALPSLFSSLLGLFQNQDITTINPWRYLASFSVSQLKFGSIGKDGVKTLEPDKLTTQTASS
jgi:hypothetical protein